MTQSRARLSQQNHQTATGDARWAGGDGRVRALRDAIGPTVTGSVSARNAEKGQAIYHGLHGRTRINRNQRAVACFHIGSYVIRVRPCNPWSFGKSSSETLRRRETHPNNPPSAPLGSLLGAAAGHRAVNPMNPTVTHSVDSDGIGWIVFDDPAARANVFTP